MHDLTGTWQLTFQDSAFGGEMMRIKIAQTDDGLSAVEENARSPYPIHISLSGIELSLSSEPRDHGQYSFVGSLNDLCTCAEGTIEVQFRATNNAREFTQRTFNATLEFLNEQTLQQEKDDAALKEKRMNDAKRLFDALRHYADRNNDTFPSALAQLLASGHIDPSLIAPAPERRISYNGTGRRHVDRDELLALANEFDAKPDSREKLVEKELRLREAWGADVPVSGYLVSIDYDNPSLTIAIDSSGQISATVPHQSEGAPDTIATMCDKEFNNLKQLGLVVKMYSHDHKGFIPGGWLSVYPEYLSDPAILHSPWETEGKLSYDLLFPGETEKGLEELAIGLLETKEFSSPTFNPEIFQDLKDPKLRAVFRSILRWQLTSMVPLIISRSTLPAEEGQPPARAVLFLDGHVEAVRLTEWDARIAPFLRQ